MAKNSVEALAGLQKDLEAMTPDIELLSYQEINDLSSITTYERWR